MIEITRSIPKNYSSPSRASTFTVYILSQLLEIIEITKRILIPSHSSLSGICKVINVVQKRTRKHIDNKTKALNSNRHSFRKMVRGSWAVQKILVVYKAREV